jgi:hypothetical protein
MSNATNAFNNANYDNKLMRDKQTSKRERLAELRRRGLTKQKQAPTQIEVAHTKENAVKQPSVDPQTVAIEALRGHNTRLKDANKRLQVRYDKANRRATKLADEVVALKQELKALQVKSERDITEQLAEAIETRTLTIQHQLDERDQQIEKLRKDVKKWKVDDYARKQELRKQYAKLYDQKMHEQKQALSNQYGAELQVMRHKFNERKVELDDLRASNQAYRDEIKTLEQALSIKKQPSPKLLQDLIDAIDASNYKLYGWGIGRLLKHWTDVAGDGRRVYADNLPVIGVIDEREDGVWFVTDDFETNLIDTNKPVSDGVVYSAIPSKLTDNQWRVYITKAYDTPDELPEKTQRVLRRNKRRKQVTEQVDLVLPELAGKTVAYISYMPNEYLAKRVNASGGEFEQIDPSETSDSRIETILTSNQYDYIMIDTGFASHAVFWKARDFIKATDDPNRIDMFEHKPNPQVLADMVSYFAEQGLSQ